MVRSLQRWQAQINREKRGCNIAGSQLDRWPKVRCFQHQATMRRARHGVASDAGNALPELTLCVIAYIQRRCVCSRGGRHTCRVCFSISTSRCQFTAAFRLLLRWRFAQLHVVKTSHLEASEVREAATRLRFTFLQPLLSANCRVNPVALTLNSEVANNCLQPSAWIKGGREATCLPPQ